MRWLELRNVTVGHPLIKYYTERRRLFLPSWNHCSLGGSLKTLHQGGHGKDGSVSLRTAEIVGGQGQPLYPDPLASGCPTCLVFLWCYSFYDIIGSTCINPSRLGSSIGMRPCGMLKMDLTIDSGTWMGYIMKYSIPMGKYIIYP